jgi:hypothetical protein
MRRVSPNEGVDPGSASSKRASHHRNLHHISNHPTPPNGSYISELHPMTTDDAETRSPLNPLADGDQRAGTRNSPENPPRPDRSAGVRAAPPNVTDPRRAAARAEGATAAAGEETAAAVEVAMRGRRREMRARAEVAERKREARGCGVGSEAGAVFVATAAGYGEAGGGFLLPGVRYSTPCIFRSNNCND